MSSMAISQGINTQPGRLLSARPAVAYGLAGVVASGLYFLLPAHGQLAVY